MRERREAESAEAKEGATALPLESGGGDAVTDTAEPRARAELCDGAAEGDFAGRNQANKAGSSGHMSGGSVRGH